MNSGFDSIFNFAHYPLVDVYHVKQVNELLLQLTEMFNRDENFGGLLK